MDLPVLPVLAMKKASPPESPKCHMLFNETGKEGTAKGRYDLLYTNREDTVSSEAELQRAEQQN